MLRVTGHLPYRLTALLPDEREMRSDKTPLGLKSPPQAQPSRSAAKPHHQATTPSKGIDGVWEPEAARQGHGMPAHRATAPSSFTTMVPSDLPSAIARKLHSQGGKRGGFEFGAGGLALRLATDGLLHCEKLNVDQRFAFVASIRLGAQVAVGRSLCHPVESAEK